MMGIPNRSMRESALSSIAIKFVSVVLFIELYFWEIFDFPNIWANIGKFQTFVPNVANRYNLAFESKKLC